MTRPSYEDTTVLVIRSRELKNGERRIVLRAETRMDGHTQRKAHSNAALVDNYGSLKSPLVLVCFDHVASIIVNADHGIM